MERNIAVLLAGLAVGAAGVSFVVNENGECVEYKAIASNAEELAGADKTAIASRLADSGAVEVTCKAGVISNMPPETIYCTDGKRAGFVLPADAAASLVAKAEATLGSAPAELRLKSDAGGKVYLEASAVAAVVK